MLINVACYSKTKKQINQERALFGMSDHENVWTLMQCRTMTTQQGMDGDQNFCRD
jgi:hypothetical protein